MHSAYISSFGEFDFRPVEFLGPSTEVLSFTRFHWDRPTITDRLQGGFDMIYDEYAREFDLMQEEYEKYLLEQIPDGSLYVHFRAA